MLIKDIRFYHMAMTNNLNELTAYLSSSSALPPAALDLRTTSASLSSLALAPATLSPKAATSA